MLAAMKEELEVKREVKRVDRNIQAEEEWLSRKQYFLDGERGRRVRERGEMRRDERYSGGEFEVEGERAACG